MSTRLTRSRGTPKSGSSTPTAPAAVEIQVMDDIETLISEAPADPSAEPLESIVRRLLTRVQVLEEQNSLITQVQAKCNALEGRLEELHTKVEEIARGQERASPSRVKEEAHDPEEEKVEEGENWHPLEEYGDGDDLDGSHEGSEQWEKGRKEISDDCGPSRRSSGTGKEIRCRFCPKAKTFNRLESFREHESYHRLGIISTSRKRRGSQRRRQEQNSESESDNPSNDDDQEEEKEPNAKEKRRRRLTCKAEGCNFIGSKPRLLLKHIRRLHPALVKPHHCKVCPPSAHAAFYEVEDLARHYTKAHSLPELMDHTAEAAAPCQGNKTKTEPQKERTCPVCSRIFSRIHYMKYHLAHKHSDTPPPKLACDVCGKTFCKKTLMRYHQEREHGGITPALATLLKQRAPYPTRPPVTCGGPQGCGREFPTPSALQRHLIPCRGLKPYQCEECGAHFSNTNSLKAHKNLKHSVDGAALLPCDVCGRMVQAARMKRHTLEHESGKPKRPRVPCPVCGKSILDKSALGRHMKSHTGERPYACTICDPPRTFAMKGAFDGHMLLHTGKPYACDECEMRFVRPYLLKKHKENHAKGTAKSIARQAFERGEVPPGRREREEVIVGPDGKRKRVRRYRYKGKGAWKSFYPKASASATARSGVNDDAANLK